MSVWRLGYEGMLTVVDYVVVGGEVHAVCVTKEHTLLNVPINELRVVVPVVKVTDRG